VSREIEGFLAAWRTAAREWESGSRQPDVARRLAGAWLAYQIAVGAVSDDEIVLIADDDASFVAATANVERYLGLDVAAVLELTIADITPPRERGVVGEAWQAFLAMSTTNGHYQLWRADGEEVPASFHARANVPAAGLHVSRLVPSATWRSQRELADVTATAVAMAAGRISESRRMVRELRGVPPVVLKRPATVEPEPVPPVRRPRLVDAI
jgi:PAS domain-containing protein